MRVDTYGYDGYATNPRFDSLLAKRIVHAPTHALVDVIRRVEDA